MGKAFTIANGGYHYKKHFQKTYYHDKLQESQINIYRINEKRIPMLANSSGTG